MRWRSLDWLQQFALWNAFSRHEISSSGLTQVAQKTGLGVLISTLAALTFIAGSWGLLPSGALAAWLLGAVAPPLYILVRSRSTLRQRPPKSVSRRALRRMVAFSALFAAPWAVLPHFFLGIDSNVDALIMTICTAISAGGAFMMHRAPAAAAAFFGTIIASFVLACVLYKAADSWPIALAAIPYHLFLSVITLSTNRAAVDGEKNLERAEKAVAGLRDANLELDRLRSSAERDAAIDELTGLCNRRGLARELARRARDRAGLAVFHLDLDRFKQINDALGHAAGDFVLRHVADVLRRETARTDHIARIGGDEFVIIADFNGDHRPVHALATRLIAELSKPVEYEGDACYFSASIGIDVDRPEEADAAGAPAGDGALDVTRMLTNADIALYRAKETGRGRFQFFSPALRERVETQKSLGDALIAGLENGQFMPLYEAQYLSDGKTLCGVEALARWHCPTLGDVGPELFRPIADRLGVTERIDAQILERVLADLAAWDRAGIGVPRVSVNISPMLLRSPTLMQELARLDIPPGRLSFEIREGVFADEFDDRLRHVLDHLDEIGVDLELVDFGAGQSTLSALLAINPKRIKIARALTQPVGRSPRHRALLQSVVGIAHSLDVEVVAKGVETETDAAAITAVGCDRLQGAYFAPPMSAEAIREAFAPVARTASSDA